MPASSASNDFYRPRTTCKVTVVRNSPSGVETATSILPEANPSRSQDSDGVMVSNEVMAYRLTERLPFCEIQLRRFITYDRLKDYWKSMIDENMSSFP